MAGQIKLSVRGLSKSYAQKDGKAALDRVSFDIRAGEFVSILGPSGCGKTTLLRILIGLLEPDEGTILLDGTDITALSPARRSMGIVFQNYALFENMTVKKNIVYAARIKARRGGKAARSEIDRRAEEMMEQLGISALADKYPAELSGGQQQRVAIARTLMHNPAVMLFDEPMSALDVATRLQLRDVIKQLQAELGTTMLYITHDQEEAFAMSDRIIVMDNAEIVQFDTPAAIVSSPASPYVEEFVVRNLQKKIDSLTAYIEG